MGWWNVTGTSDITVGDTVLDLVRHFLKDFSGEYEEDLGRKPTVAELEYVLDLAFKVNLDDAILSGFEELEVKQVTLKLAKRPKRQNAKPGDIFAFRLEDGRFGFGRVVSMVSFGSVVELFDYFSEQPIFDFSKLGTWLIPPTTIDTYSLLDARKDGDWRIIGQTPDFEPDEKFKTVRFVYGTPPHRLMAVDIFDKEEPITVEAAAGLPTFDANGDYDIQQMVKARLGSVTASQ